MDERELSEWVAAHDARMTLKWEQQDKQNTMNEVRHTEIVTQLGALRWRVAWFTGLCAGVAILLAKLIS